MVNVMTEFEVEDIDKFKEGIEKYGVDLRERHGCLSVQWFRIVAPGNRVIAVVKWESREHYETFLKDPAVGQAMYARGTLNIDKITYMEQLGEWKADKIP